MSDKENKENKIRGTKDASARGGLSGAPAEARNAADASRLKPRTGKKKHSLARGLGKTAKTTGHVFGRVISIILNIILTVVLVAIVTGVVAGCAFAVYIRNFINPTIDESLLPASGTDKTTKIYYMDYTDRENRVGEAVEIEDQRLHGEENSLWAQYSDIPQDLKDAFVSIEDHRFWDHNGIDWLRTGKAALNFFMKFDSRFGGSTITQQLIKNLTQYDDVTIQRKVQEILCAMNLEKTKSKEEILELYLNIVPLSQHCTGVEAAAYTYFGKDVSELTLIECAAIAGITNAPTKYDPIQNPENNAARRDAVLEKMLEYGKITQEEYESAHGQELVLDVHRASDSITTNSWYTDTVIDDIINDLVEQKSLTRQVASNLIYSGGLKIYTLMDPEVQNTMEAVFEDDSNFPADTGIPAECSMCIVDPYTGDLLGVVGGRGEKEGNRILNYATQTTRPPGSSVKPLSIYAPALEEGIINYATVYDDTPVNFGTNAEKPVAWPANTPAGYYGLTTINDAIERSCNTVAVKVLYDLSIEKSFSYLRDSLGFSDLVEYAQYSDGTGYTDKGLAALALGQLNNGVTVRDITTAYCVFQNKGVYSKSRSYIYVYDSTGEILLNNEYEGKIVFTEQTASIMTQMLKNVVSYGTARSVTLRYSIDCAGKTGTSSNDYDRWFLGYTPYYVGGVWYGYAMPKNLSSLAQNPCNLIWNQIMTTLHQKYMDKAASGGESLRHFEIASGVVKATFCLDSGQLLSDACSLDPRGSRADVGYFTSGNMPSTACTTHVVVKYDSVTGGVAHAGCPSENLIDTALIKVTTRSFPIQIYVTDAQYVYRELAAGVRPGAYWSVPFFQNMLGEKEYCGITNVWGGRQYNCFCYEHFDFDAFDNKGITASTTALTTDARVPLE